MTPALNIDALAQAYRTGALTPLALVELLIERRRATRSYNIWIREVDDDALRARARELASGGDPGSIRGAIGANPSESLPYIAARCFRSSRLIPVRKK